MTETLRLCESCGMPALYAARGRRIGTVDLCHVHALIELPAWLLTPIKLTAIIDRHDNASPMDGCMCKRCCLEWKQKGARGKTVIRWSEPTIYWPAPDSDFWKNVNIE